MSLYAEYVRERTDDQIIENDKGFATYRFVDNNTVFILDIYIRPDFRKYGEASNIADNIVEIAKKRGCTTLLGGVVPSTKNSTISLKVLLGYGMTLKYSNVDFICFEKAI